MSVKPSEVLRFLGALAAAIVLLLLLVLRVTGCSSVEPRRPPPPAPVTERAEPGRRPEAGCAAPEWRTAAEANARSLKALDWAPFGRTERGWEVYAPLIQQEIGSACPPDSEGFAAAFAAWQGNERQLPTGRMNPEDFQRLKNALQGRREFVRFTGLGGCPEPSDEIAAARPAEGYMGKLIHLRPGALRAYRQMVAAARAEVPEIAQDPRNLTIFSGYRSPAYDAQRCQQEGNCNGIVRARCSAHRTGLALDLYVGEAPGYGPDSSADPNRLHMVGTPTYRWLLANAHRFGFVNYPFEPWHWEWTGEPP